MTELYLMHHGIKGMKWGIRRFRHEDGSVTPAGAKRYYDGDMSAMKGKSKVKVTRKESSKETSGKGSKGKMSTKKKVAITGAAVAGTLLAAYGAKKYMDATKRKAGQLKYEEMMRGVNGIYKEELMEREKAKVARAINPVKARAHMANANAYAQTRMFAEGAAINEANKMSRSFKESRKYLKELKRG